jgi:hypothetical protein
MDSCGFGTMLKVQSEKSTSLIGRKCEVKLDDRLYIGTVVSIYKGWVRVWYKVGDMLFSKEFDLNNHQKNADGSFILTIF